MAQLTEFLNGNTNIGPCTVAPLLLAMQSHTSDHTPVPWETAFPGMTNPYYCLP